MGQVPSLNTYYINKEYAKSSSVYNDLDLEADNMVVARNALSCQNEHLCQFTLKSNNIQKIISITLYVPLKHRNKHTDKHKHRGNTLWPSSINMAGE